MKNYEVIALHRFSRDLKKLVRKYPSLKKEYLTLVNELEIDPTQGISLGNNCYKIRLAIQSKGKGKSGGSRVITHVMVAESIVYLLSIYDKSDHDSITDKELDELIRGIVN